MVPPQDLGGVPHSQRQKRRIADQFGPAHAFEPTRGTRFASSPLSVPTITPRRSPRESVSDSAYPRRNHSLAMAIAGNTCPPVPPPATNNSLTAELTPRPRAG